MLHRHCRAAFAVAWFPACALAQSSEPASATLGEVVVRGRPAAERLSLDAPNTTGSRLGLTPRETPASVTVIDRDRLDATGALTTQDALAAAAGVTFAAPPGSAGSVSYRGFTGGQITQLFNGISVQYDPIAARPVDSWTLDRVEVLGGPSTFLFGAGAVGGAINYISKLATRDADFAQVRAIAGSYDAVQLAGGINRRFGNEDGVRHAVRVDVNRATSNGWVDGEQRTAWTAAASLLTDLTPRLSHTLAVESQDEQVARPYWGTPLLQPTTGEGRIRPDTRFANYNARDGNYAQNVTWLRSIVEWRATDATTVRNTFYRYDALRDFANVEVFRFNAANSLVNRTASFLQRHDQDLTGNRVEATHEGTLLGLRSQWAGGLDVSLNHQTRFPRSLTNQPNNNVDPVNFVPDAFFSIPGMLTTYVPDRANRIFTVAVFAENRTKLTDAWSLVTGLRHDRVDLDVTNFRTVTATDPAFFSRIYTPTTGRVGLVYDLSATANVYAQVSSAADPPAGVLATATFNQVRNFDLTTGRQVEIGTKFDWLDGRGVATLAAYDITRRNLAITDPLNSAAVLPVGQQGSRGVEASVAVRPVARLLLQGNASWVDAQFDQFVESIGTPAISVSREGNTPPNVPSTVANLWATWTFAPGWDVGIDVRHVGRVYANTANTTTAPAYTLLGASLAVQASRDTRVVLRGRNLTDEVYAQWTTGTPMFWLGAPRTFEVLVQSTF